MSIWMKIALGLGAVILILGSTLVTIAALFPPKEYKGDGKVPKSGTRDESNKGIAT